MLNQKRKKMAQLTKEAKEVLIGIAVLVLILLAVFTSWKVYEKKVKKLDAQIQSLESELLKNKIGREILWEGLQIAERTSDSLKNEIDILIKNKPKVKPKPNAPINYSLPSSKQDSLFTINYNRFKQGGI